MQTFFIFFSIFADDKELKGNITTSRYFKKLYVIFICSIAFLTKHILSNNGSPVFLPQSITILQAPPALYNFEKDGIF